MTSSMERGMGAAGGSVAERRNPYGDATPYSDATP